MGRKLTGHIKGCKLYAKAIGGNHTKHAVRNALGRLPQIISGKHPIDIRIVHRPETLLYIHGIGIDAGDHQNLFPRRELPLFLHTFQFFYEP